MQDIIVTGANGQLGRELQQLAFVFPDYQFHFSDRTELDITNADQVNNVFGLIKPAYCINCAAYTAVDKAESEREAAFAINAKAVENLAAACKVNGAKFVHVSTDYVFNGQGIEPYSEESPTDPVNYYGESKLKGEELAMQANPDSVIIRTSWVYSAFGNNFVKTMLRLMQSRPEISVVADQAGSPTYAADLAEAIMQIVDSDKWEPGIYHFSNEGVITWFEFAQAIQQSIQADCQVKPIPTEQYPTPAKRPSYSGLNKEKIQRIYGVELKPWKQSLQRCLKALQSA